MRISRSLPMIVLVVPGLLAAQYRPDTAPCPGESRAARGAIGVAMYHCVGGRCWYNDTADDAWYQFASEPRLRDLDPAGPAARAGLASGDVLVAIDGMPITTAGAGRELARLSAGRPVTLQARRGTRLLEVVVAPVAGCRLPGLVVTPTDRWPVELKVGLTGDRAATNQASTGWERLDTVVAGVGVKVYGAPVEVTTDRRTGEMVITSGSNVVRIRPVGRGVEQ